MVFDFILYTSLVCLIAYLTVMMFYYKTLLGKERTMRDFMKTNLDDTEIVIRKLQVQLQRSLGNIDILTDELNKIKPVFVELGLQTIHDKTAKLINRGHNYEVFEKAVKYGLYDEKRKAIVIRKGEYIVDANGSWDLEINDLLFPCMEGFYEE